MSGIVGNPGSTRSGKVIQNDLTTTTSNDWVVVPNALQSGVEFMPQSNGIKFTRATTYGAVRLRAKYRHFCLGFDAKCTSGSYWGAFWGNDVADAVEGGSTTGWKTTFNNSTTFAIRTINGNSDQTTFNPGYAPDNGAWHHHQIETFDTNYTYVHIDGNERLSHAQTQPSYGAYCGLLIYNRAEVEFRNITIYEGAQLMDLATG